MLILFCRRFRSVLSGCQFLGAEVGIDDRVDVHIDDATQFSEQIKTCFATLSSADSKRSTNFRLDQESLPPARSQFAVGVR